jgi:ATP/maltotriose-dependent transcriptional regulator MalT
VEDLARAALGFAEYALAPGGEQQQLALLEEASRALSSVEHAALRARVLGLLGGEYVWSFDAPRSEALTQEALAVARHLDDAPTLAYVLNERLWALIFSGTRRLPERVALSTELVAVANQLGDANLVLKGHRGRLLALLEAGDMAGVDAELTVLAPKAAASRQVVWLRMLTVWRTMRALVAGQFDAVAAYTAEQRAVMAQWHAESAGPEELSDCYMLIQLQRLRGEHAAAVALLADFVSGHSSWIRAGRAHWLVEAQHALLDAEQDRLADARAGFERLLAGNTAELRHGGGAAAALAALAEVCAVLGDRVQAARLYPLLHPYAGGTIVFRWGYACVGAAEYYLGLLAQTQQQGERAAQHFEAALDLNERMGARPYLARTQTAYAALLLARGQRSDRSHARALVEAALQTYMDLGMAWWAQRVRGQFAGFLAPGTPRRRAFPDGLSEREVEVLRLVAAGKSNPEIGAALVISRDTVERHVTHILSKTGCSNRVEATRYAQRHGLVEP